MNCKNKDCKHPASFHSAAKGACQKLGCPCEAYKPLEKKTKEQAGA